MSKPIHLNRAGIALAASCAFLALPAAAQAAAVDLGTAKPFVVLGGPSVSNTGPSVLNGDLGVSPGTSLTGFQFATVNGATHNNDAVAAGAQSDLTTAYNTAAGEATTADLTGQDLGGMTLTPGAYNFSSSAGLTGTLTLDAQGNPNAQFVFKIGTTLTTATASRVEVINGGSPCNVYWQVGSSATLGTTTAFKGNLMAAADISLNNGTTVTGRVLAKNAVTLNNNVIDGSGCAAGTTPTPPVGTPPGGTPPGGTPPGGTPPVGTPPGTPTTAPGTAPSPGVTNQAPPKSRSTVPTRNGSAIFRRTPGGSCRDGFRARVRGKKIKRVVFSMDGKRISSRSKSPFAVSVRGLAGRHQVTARVTFTDATRAKTLKLGYRACAAALLQPRHGPSRFTG
jgi:hypothetical protein